MCLCISKYDRFLYYAKEFVYIASVLHNMNYINFQSIVTVGPKQFWKWPFDYCKSPWFSVGTHWHVFLSIFIHVTPLSKSLQSITKNKKNQNKQPLYVCSQSLVGQCYCFSTIEYVLSFLDSWALFIQLKWPRLNLFLMEAPIFYCKLLVHTNIKSHAKEAEA